MGMGILLALVMSALLWAASQSAQAQTVDESQAQIAALRVQTEEPLSSVRTTPRTRRA
jgi:hypothetical protein